jgi:hypothetical protein
VRRAANKLATQHGFSVYTFFCGSEKTVFCGSRTNPANTKLMRQRLDQNRRNDPDHRRPD